MKPSDNTKQTNDNNDNKQDGQNQENNTIFVQSESHEIWKVAQRYKFVAKHEATTQLTAQTLKIRCYGHVSFSKIYASFKKASLHFPKWITSFTHFEIDNKLVVLISDPPTPPQSDEEKK
eukprot:374728_1